MKFTYENMNFTGEVILNVRDHEGVTSNRIDMPDGTCRMQSRQLTPCEVKYYMAMATEMSMYTFNTTNEQAKKQ